MRSFNPDSDYYEILQVHPRAHQEVIKRAYRTIVKLLQAHPDLGGTHEDAIRVNEAYEVLSNPETRRAYDAARRQAAGASSAHATPPTAHAAAQAYAANRAPGAAATSAAQVKRGYRQQPPRAVGTQTVYCPGCGARNRLPADADLRRAICGKCRASLAVSEGKRAGALLPLGEVRLHTREQHLLTERGELRIRRGAVPADKRLHCLRCHFEWTALSSDVLPSACPRCRSTRWSVFRLFRCRHCGHQFPTASLYAWAYWLFAECPACRRRHWHVGCERSPLRWVLNRISV